MATGFFGRVIGRAAARHHGLNAIYLPPAVGAEFAGRIVQEANQIHRTGPGPYSILVSEHLDSTPDVPAVSANQATAYRHGDRLAVVLATSVNVTSVENTFREAIGPGYPATSIPGFDIATLGGEALELLAASVGASPDEVDTETGNSLLSDCMKLTAELLADERDGSANWNSDWYLLVDRALAALSKELQDAVETGSARTFDELIVQHALPAFGLPQISRLRTRANTLPRIINGAVADHWGSEEQVSLLTKETSILGGPDAEGLETCQAIGWEGLDEYLARHTSTFAGLQAFVADRPELLRALAAVTESAFRGAGLGASEAILLDHTGEDAGLLAGAPTPMYFFDSELHGDRLLADWMTVSVKPAGLVEEQQVGASRARIQIASAAADPVEATSPVLTPEGRIDFRLRVHLRGKQRTTVRKIVLNIDVPQDDALFGHITRQTLTAQIVPPTSTGLVIAAWSSGTKRNLRVPAFHGPSSGSDVENEVDFSVELRHDVQYRILLKTADQVPSTQLLRLAQTSRPGWWAGDLPANTSAEVSAGGVRWLLEPQVKATSPQSLLLAAISGVNVDPTDPDDDTVTSLRGRLESVVGECASSAAFLSGLGHMVLPADQAVAVEQFEPDGPILVPTGLKPIWRNSDDEEAPTSDWLSARDAFIKAWTSCLDLLPMDENSSAGRSVVWPSKRSTHLLAEQPEVLDELLNTYAALVDASQGGSPLLRLASAYPFSASIWTVRTHNPTCDGVLLSPWHPIRLTWLTHAEHTLRKSTRARALAGTIEGWRFPVMGPSDLTYKKMIALPTDSGDGDVFAAWSMMIPVGADAAELRVPMTIAGSTPPGSSASGLTGSAADAAMRDFRRVNQHLPSITIDLASSALSPRLHELDASVIRAVRVWSDKGTLRGVNVRDSLNRSGDIPRGEVTELLDEGIECSLSWARYQPAKGDPVRSNLRLLQDSGIQIGVEPVDARADGIISRTPLRRFEAHSPLTRRGALKLNPAIEAEGPFTRALAAVEQFGGAARAMNVVMRSGHLLDENADWTISGQSYVSASLLANVLSNASTTGSNSKMLWEWRPPFLSPNGSSPLNRRPYASIMRIGNQLRANIAERLEKLGAETNTGVRSILETLGAQGIGLSSLMSMGGHHAAGALGFYLTLRLMELAQPSNEWIQLVMPIDACREFLDALAPDAKAPETRRQADLLVIRAREGEVCLIPLEVKLYGVDGDAPAGLPKQSDFHEPREQLASTNELLRRVLIERARIDEDDAQADAALWDTALATLIEAGLGLSRVNEPKSALASKVLRSIVTGEYTRSIGRPLITFYRHHANSGDEYESYKEGRTTSADLDAAYGALAARPASVWRTVSGVEGPQEPQVILETWRDLVNWSQQYAVSPSTAEAQLEETAEDEESVPVVPDRRALVPREAADVTCDEESTPATDARGVERDAGEATEVVAPMNMPAESIGPTPLQESFSAAPRRALLDASNDADPMEAMSPNNPKPQGGTEGVKLSLGHVLDSLGCAPAEYWPSNTATTQLNMGIVGDLGTGKTQLLKSILVGLRNSSLETQETPVSGLVFDYKKDFQDEEFRNSVNATLWDPYDMPLNVLELYEPYSKQSVYRRASGFASMLERIYSNIGPKQRNRLIAVIMELFEERQGRAPSLDQVLARYSDDNAPSDSLTSVLNNFVLPGIFKQDLSATTTLDEAMQGKFLVVNLNDWGADHQMKNAIVVLFLDMFYEAMKRSIKKPFKVNADGVTLRTLHSYLLVDEASNIMDYDFPVLESLLKEGREFGVGTILSSQYLSHFRSKKTNFAQTLSTWFIHKVPNVTPAELSALGIAGADKAMAERIRQLKVHESLHKSDLFPARFIRETPYWELMQQ